MTSPGAMLTWRPRRRCGRPGRPTSRISSSSYRPARPHRVRRQRPQERSGATISHRKDSGHSGHGGAGCGARRTSVSWMTRPCGCSRICRADLRERGWTFSPSESRAAQSASWCRAVYQRPFDDRLDRERDASATYDKLTRRQIVRVSTSSDHSSSWPDARRDAIRRMHEADVSRRGAMEGGEPDLAFTKSSGPVQRRFRESR